MLSIGEHAYEPYNGKTYATAVNVWDEDWELGSYDGSGAKASSSTTIRNKNFIPALPNTTYSGIVTSLASQIYFYVYFYQSDGTFISSQTRISQSGYYTFTTPSNCTKMNFYVANSYGATYNNDISINFPATETAYIPYKGAEVTADYMDSFGHGVYGGTLDLTTGEGVITDFAVDLGTLDWVANASYSNTFNGTSLNPLAKYVANAISWKCSDYQSYTSTTVGTVDAGIAIGASEYIVYVRDIRYSDPATFKAAMDGVKLVYKLKTPIPFTIDPTTDIVTLLGENNIFADTGAIEELIYRISRQNA